MKKKIYNEIINKENAMYNLDSFQQFCISTGATKLFDKILNLVTTAPH